MTGRLIICSREILIIIARSVRTNRLRLGRLVRIGENCVLVHGRSSLENFEAQKNIKFTALWFKKKKKLLDRIFAVKSNVLWLNKFIVRRLFEVHLRKLKSHLNHSVDHAKTYPMSLINSGLVTYRAKIVGNMRAHQNYTYTVRGSR